MPNNRSSATSAQRINVMTKLNPESETASKKEIENVHVFDAEDFQYNKILGEGAFGIVRKAQLQLTNENNSSTSESSSEENKDKFKTEDSRIMAVKLQSKY